MAAASSRRYQLLLHSTYYVVIVNVVFFFHFLFNTFMCYLHFSTVSIVKKKYIAFEAQCDESELCEWVFVSQKTAPP